MVSGGWPAVIASLKTLLETGDPLPLARLQPRIRWHTSRPAAGAQVRAAGDGFPAVSEGGR